MFLFIFNCTLDVFLPVSSKKKCIPSKKKKQQHFEKLCFTFILGHIQDLINCLGKAHSMFFSGRLKRRYLDFNKYIKNEESLLK